MSSATLDTAAFSRPRPRHTHSSAETTEENTMSTYGMSVSVDAPMDQVLDRTRAALADQGFGILTAHRRRGQSRLQAALDPEPVMSLLNPATSATAAADARIDPRHPFAAHLRRVDALDREQPHRVWTPEDGALPSLFISHGAPPTFTDPVWMEQLVGWARALPKPKAVLIVSAHWESDSLGITSTVPTELVYDFGGFERTYYEMRLDTPEASGLARQVRDVLPDTEHLHEHRRGLDHGAWVPLKIMYPHADVPVLQLSLPTRASTAKLLEIGSRLRTLREQGVLVIGSGFMIHGLPYITRDAMNGGAVPGWSAEFDAWAADALSRGDVEELAHFRTRAPGVRYAHPTVEHFTPLFVTLGAATDPTASVTTTIEGYMVGLSKRSFQAA
jgi:4,5-DOPA dioxygenase extradiol